MAIYANTVQSMKQNGNVVANKIYNPKNRRPDIPLDADEVDSAMERYIRKKYQEKSLSDGKPLPPARNDPDIHYSRNDTDTYPSRSPGNSSPPPLPPKKGKFFGFGLRAVSSAHPLSKHDKKNSPVEPRVDRAFRIGSETYNDPPRSGGGPRMSEDDLQKQLIVLREMGFRDTQRNTALLRATDGDVERTIATLIKMDEREARSASSKQTPLITGSTRNTSASTSFPSEAEVAKSQPQPPRVSTNPFDQMPTGASSNQELSFAQPQQPQPTGRSYQSEPQGTQSNNLFDMPTLGQTDQGLAQAFQGMQVSQPLFPHSTGGHPAQLQQDPRLQYSMSPPVPAIPQQYGYTASPTVMTSSNPFFQSNTMAQNTGSNPYASGQQQLQSPVQSSNPFFQQGSSFAQQQQAPSQVQQSASYNPFGIPPQPQQYSPQQARSQPQPQSIFDYHQQPTQQAPQQQMAQSIFDYSQQAQPQSAISQQMQSNPYMTRHHQQQQQEQPAFQPNPYQPQFQGQPQPLMQQQTGRYDKSSILALYNYPQLAPQQQLASIPEPSEGQTNAPGDMISQKRSVTMPVLSMHSAGGGGSRNPFMSTAAPQGGVRHTSVESVQINNLQNGRHSPDAFANLSARYMR